MLYFVPQLHGRLSTYHMNKDPFLIEAIFYLTKTIIILDLIFYKNNYLPMFIYRVYHNYKTLSYILRTTKIPPTKEGFIPDLMPYSWAQSSSLSCAILV